MKIQGIYYGNECKLKCPFMGMFVGSKDGCGKCQYHNGVKNGVVDCARADHFMDFIKQVAVDFKPKPRDNYIPPPVESRHNTDYIIEVRTKNENEIGLIKDLESLLKGYNVMVEQYDLSLPEFLDRIYLMSDGKFEFIKEKQDKQTLRQKLYELGYLKQFLNKIEK